MKKIFLVLLVAVFIFLSSLACSAPEPAPTPNLELTAVPSPTPTALPTVAQFDYHMVISSGNYYVKTVTSGSWWCRVGPSRANDAVVALDGGTLVSVVEKTGNWILVDTGQETCYIYQDAIK